MMNEMLPTILIIILAFGISILGYFFIFAKNKKEDKTTKIQKVVFMAGMIIFAIILFFLFTFMIGEGLI